MCRIVDRENAECESIKLRVSLSIELISNSCFLALNHYRLVDIVLISILKIKIDEFHI